MTSDTLPECPRYIEPPPTQLDLDFADLAIIDLSKLQTPKGRGELALQLRDALRTNGFVYAINHGYTQVQRDRVFDIANVPKFYGPEEMNAYAARIDKGNYAGFKGRRYWRVDEENDVWDQMEQYKSTWFVLQLLVALAQVLCDVTKQPHPLALRPFLPELDAFARHSHFHILHGILRLIAVSLELPEDTLVEKHTFEGRGATSVTFLKYYRRSEEEEEKSKNVWFKGHTDLGSLTILWSQPVSSPDGNWRWVRHIENALVINTGDMLEFLTGGYYKPTIHRVVQPPQDQRTYERLGTFYFAVVDDDVRLLPLLHSPVLQRVRIERRCPDEHAPLAGKWRKERTILYGRVTLTKAEDNTEEEIVEGIVVKHYN